MWVLCDFLGTSFLIFHCGKKKKKKSAAQLSSIGCESLGCLCVSAVTLWIFHYGALGPTLHTVLLPFSQHPWQPGRPLSPQKCTFNWVSSNQAVKYSSRFKSRSTGDKNYKQLSLCLFVKLTVPILVWFNKQIHRVGGIPIRSFGGCMIGYDEPFLRLHQLGEEACLWCAEITRAERSRKLRLNTY